MELTIKRQGGDTMNRIEIIATFGMLEKLLENDMKDEALDVVKRTLKAAEGKDAEKRDG